MTKARPMAERFWEKVPVRSPWPEDCWEWTAYVTPDGYGRFQLSARKNSNAHLVAWRLSGSDIPTGWEIDHACRNRRCVRPEHLSLVPKNYNAKQGRETRAANQRKKTHCRNGHAYAAEEYKPTKEGWRVCGQCARDNANRWNRKQKEGQQ